MPPRSARVNTTLATESRTQPLAQTSTASRPPQKCSFCTADHFIARCAKFELMEPHQRRMFMSTNRLCYTCLGSHSSVNCESEKRCLQCHEKHHTMIHTMDNIIRRQPSATTTAARSITEVKTSSNQQAVNASGSQQASTSSESK